MDGTKAAMEMYFVHYKTNYPINAATFAANNGIGYSAAVVEATTAPIDPAGVAVIAYQVDVSFSSASSSACKLMCFSSGWS